MLRTLTIACFLCAPISAAEVVGWRHDTTGRFPDATPPLRWEPDSAKIAWKLAMPGRSGGHPLIVGERIYAMADPHWLCCVDEASGELRWKRAITAEQVTVAGSVERVAERGARCHALWERREELERRPWPAAWSTCSAQTATAWSTGPSARADPTAASHP